MLTFQQAILVAIATGSEPPSALRIIDQALAQAGLSRSERRKTIASLKASAAVAPEQTERIAP